MLENISIRDVSSQQEIIKEVVDTNNNVLGRVKAKNNISGQLYSPASFSSFYSTGRLGLASQTKPHIYIADLYVNKECRKQGIGRKLVSAIVQKSKELGYEGRVILLAGSNEGSPLPFYRKLGFVADDRRLNAKIDDFLKFRIPLDPREQAFMTIPKQFIQKLLRMK